MKPIVTVAEMQDADRRAAQVPAALERLVQRAGGAVAAEALRMLGGAYGRRVVVVAGPGNNGADGRVAADRLRRRGARVSVVPAARRGEPPPRLPVCDLVIDAAFGTGFSGEYVAPDPQGAPVLSVDIASGLDGDRGTGGEAAVRADATVTFAALKPGLLQGEGPERCGRVTVADIGLHPEPARAHLVGDEDLSWVPRRPRDGHKWERAVWVVAGSPGMRGAGALCGRAALRAGAGYVRVGSPGVDADEHPADEAVAVSLPARDWDAVVIDGIDRFGAIVLGPGLGRGPDIADPLRRLVRTSPVPVVVDADGLFALGGADELDDVLDAAKAPIVLTPHAGEYARLVGEPPGPDRIGAARRLAARGGAIGLVKGSTTAVADHSGAVLVSTAGSSRLATAGTGDVLSGVIGALVACGVDPFRAAALGAHVHGRAAARGRGVGMVAGDLPELVSSVLSEYLAPDPVSSGAAG